MKKADWIPLGMFILAVFTLLFVPALYSTQYESVSTVFEDVVSFGRMAPLVGFMSDLGVCFWFASAGMILHGFYRILRDTKQFAALDALFYLGWASILIYLGLDDRLMLHEWMTESKGIAELIIMLVYAGVVSAFVLFFSQYFLEQGRGWLILAIVAFTLSVFIDLGFHNFLGLNSLSEFQHTALEEGAKWIGICGLYIHAFVLAAAPPSCLNKK